MSTEELKVVEEETPADSLELVIVEKSVGYLQTNIRGLELYVENQLKEYDPEKFKGDADLAKKKRAELNNAAEKIKRARINLINELMKPYQDFETRCMALEKSIAKASGLLDEIVKLRDREEDDKKRNVIEQFWKAKNFDLFPLEKIWNPRWLNKTFKESDILKEMDAKIEKTYKDLKTLEKYSVMYELDAETIKSHYLINLNVEDTISYCDELQRQKEIVAKEKAEREEREHTQAVRTQQKELMREALEYEQNKETADLASQALASVHGEAPKPMRKEFVITVRCFDDEVMKLKAAMNALQIEYSVKELSF